MPRALNRGTTSPFEALRRSQRPATARSAPRAAIKATEDLGRAIVCAACRHPVTSEHLRISVDQRHQHRCVNPQGIVFHIGCFRDAPGCRTVGQPTMEFTWFQGFAWDYALCGACAALLGWRFQSAGRLPFFGLILNRLASDEPLPQ